METYVIHNVPYYYEPATNKLYVYNDTKLHIGTYDPDTHNVLYRDDMPHEELATQLREWRATLGSSARAGTSANAGTNAGTSANANTCANACATTSKKNSS